jgi:hypothetical protein
MKKEYDKCKRNMMNASGRYKCKWKMINEKGI